MIHLKHYSNPRGLILLAKRALSTNSSSLVKIEDNHELNLRRILMVNEKQRNSLGIDMIRELQKSINSTDLEKCRVLVIASSNKTVFSSGHNLKEFTTKTGAQHHETVFNEFTNLCLSLKDLPIPTIAQVDGLAAAAGYQLAASCDLIVASEKSSFSTPGVKFGVFCTTPGVALSRSVSSKIALKMLFTGEAMNAEQALQHGIISDLVKSGSVEARVNEIAKLIVANSKPVIALGKKAFYKQIEQASLGEAYKLASCVMVDNLKYEDTQSGLEAFANKKKPVWSNSNKKIE